MSFFVIGSATLFTCPEELSFYDYGVQMASTWYDGLWTLLSFTMQMVLILVLGHLLALSQFVNRVIFKFIGLFSNALTATIGVLVLTLMVALINWGLGLIFGAVLARKLGEYAYQKKWAINYPLVGAAAYSGMMIWHGGLSGSAPLSIAEKGHFLAAQTDVISLSQTVFSLPNIFINVALILSLAFLVFYISKNKKAELPSFLDDRPEGKVTQSKRSYLFVVLGLFMIGVALARFIQEWKESGDFSGAINLNFINFTLMGLCFLLLPNPAEYERKLGEASQSAASILIQFPLYAGIMTVMKSSGMMAQMADFFVDISNEVTYPIFTLISAAMVNVLVPSGGGQWAVQGPVIVEAAIQLGVSLPKSVMALAYGDQLSNMIQPFWALPLLGITGIKAKQLLPYTFLMMCVGFIIFSLGLLFWTS